MTHPLLVQTLAVAVGGASGAVLRFWTNHWVRNWLGGGFPVATLIVNVSGSFMLGFLTAYLLDNASWPVWLRVALGAGVMGALTTFSTFSLETVLLFQQGDLFKAGLNIMLNVVVCLAAVWLGLQLAR
jgi:CrcB protein